MFVQHKQLKTLNVPAEKVVHLHLADGGVQLAFAGYPPQFCRAYLVQVTDGQKALVVVAFYLMKSQESIFFVPKGGQVSVAQVAGVYDEGYTFVESMGFMLTESDFHLLSEQEKKKYWYALPICRSVQAGAAVVISSSEEQTEKAYPTSEVLQELTQIGLESLGRYLASI
ncbi:MAG: hypothetical protein C0622_04785 [Desulfuromonas sp.]|nr:MAG: hypothetical protein C0622_04785 [Desulfuromonas sp.]